MVKVPEKHMERYGKSDTGRLRSGVANPIDQHVGSRLRQHRSLLGLSQEMVGKAVDLTFSRFRNTRKALTRSVPAGCINSAKFLVSAYLNFFDETPTEILSRRRL